MLDRFKFKVWDEHAKKYLETKNGRYFKPVGHRSVRSVSWFMERKQYVVEQCTSLRCKDGTPIYEGNIVKFDIDSNRTSLVGVVKFGDGHTYIEQVLGEYVDCVGLRHARNVEGLGNIRENPELLDGDL